MKIEVLKDSRKRWYWRAKKRGYILCSSKPYSTFSAARNSALTLIKGVLSGCKIIEIGKGLRYDEPVREYRQ